MPHRGAAPAATSVVAVRCARFRARPFSVAAAAVSTLPAGAARLRSFVRSLPMRLVFTRAGSGAFIARARFGALAGVPRPR